MGAHESIHLGIHAMLRLADDSSWRITAAGPSSFPIVSRFVRSMQLDPVRGEVKSPGESCSCILLVGMGSTEGGGAEAGVSRRFSTEMAPSASQIGGSPDAAGGSTKLAGRGGSQPLVVHVGLRSANSLGAQLIQVSSAIALHAQSHDALLVHGALLEWEGNGFVLAGPGGVGKTTACQRLPPPWRAMSDDATFLVRDRRGRYWAHPWPTWSVFAGNGTGGSWDVQRAVPLQGIFFLSQGPVDEVKPIGPGKAVCMVLESVRQASWPTSESLAEEEKLAVHLQRFENACALMRTVRSYLLQVSRRGAFWREIETIARRDRQMPHA